MTRLIDADALKESVHTHDYMLKDCLNTTDKGMFTVGIMQAIDEQPTVDAEPVSDLKDTEKERDYWMDKAHSYEQTILRLTVSTGEVPVRHGKWIGYAGTIGNECSVCGKWLDVLQGTAEMNYCPHCGSRMDKDE